MNYYDKINWKNRSEGKTTKISAERLNHMDNQIFDNANAIGNVEKIADIGDGTLCGAAESLNGSISSLNQSLAINSTTISNHANLQINKQGHRVDITGMALLNGTSMTITVPYASRDGKWYAPVTGVNAAISTPSGYGFAYLPPKSKNLAVHLSSANTYAALNFTYFTDD